MGTFIPDQGSDKQNGGEAFLTVKDCQQVELSIMKELHRYLVEHGLTYAMAYGTLLGAVRHKGFIPWDNDMDIVMPRPDYERFLELVQSNPVSEHLYLLHHSTNSRYHYQCARLCDDRTSVAPPYIRESPARMGLWVDIFPLDGMWESKMTHFPIDVQLKVLKVFQRADIYALPNEWGLKNTIKRLLHSIVPNRNNSLQRKIDELGMRCPYENAERVANVTEFEFFGEHFAREDLEKPVLLPFEDTEFYAPKNWDLWLEPYYGDYRQLPPIEDRMTHDLRATWVEGAE